MKTKRLTFEKENGCWYICLPRWIGSKHNLMMVAGADTLLDQLSIFIHLNINEDIKISLEVQTSDNREELKELPSTLLYQQEGSSLFGGANYKMVKGVEGKNFVSNFWLCPVTLFVYAQYPKWFSANISTVQNESK